MAGAGYKLFAAGDVLSASDVNTYMMQQTVMVFASSAARTTALSSVLAEGMVSYLKDTNVLEVYDGSAWVGATGDITGLTAGTGISITSATGPVPTVAIDTAVVPQLGAANTFTGQNIVNAAGTSTVDLIVRATASQTSDLFQAQDSSSNLLTNISSAGVLTLWANDGANAHRTIVTANTSGIIFNTTRSAGTASTFVIQTDGSERFSVQAGAPARFTGTAAAAVGLIVRGAASQTANLQEWQDSSGNVLSSIDAFGRLRIRTTTTSAFSAAITAASAATVGLMVQGAASQTADLQQWQNSAGTVLGLVTASGAIGSAVGFTNTGNTGSYLDTTTNQMTVIQRVAGTTAFAVRGASGQTANLQSWQTNVGGVLASVDASGNIRGTSVRSLNDFVSLLEANSGGYVRMTRQTAATPNPGANLGSLYFRDGTNAGTLKLVVRAGASGAETTILDNIPQ